MLKVLMLDLGDTLVHSNQLYPGVKEALEAFQEFHVSESQPLELCLVSDYQVMGADASQEKLDCLFEEYISLLNAFELRPYFEPVNKRITLSAHAGVYKPDSRIFKKALQRLGTTAHLRECAFITENSQHVDAAREIGIDALRFDPEGSGNFSDWSEVPLLIERRIADDNAENFEIALRAYISVIHHAELIQVEQIGKDRIRARLRSPSRLTDSRLGDLDGIYVSVPVEAEIKLRRDGTVDTANIASLSPTGMEEIVKQVLTLKEHGQIGPVASHNIEVDALGHRHLLRKRFEQFDH